MNPWPPEVPHIPPPTSIYLHSIPLQGKIQNRTSGAWSPHSLHTSEAEAWTIKVRKKIGFLEKHGAMVNITPAIFGLLPVYFLFSSLLLIPLQKNTLFLGSPSARHLSRECSWLKRKCWILLTRIKTNGEPSVSVKQTHWKRTHMNANTTTAGVLLILTNNLFSFTNHTKWLCLHRRCPWWVQSLHQNRREESSSHLTLKVKKIYKCEKHHPLYSHYLDDTGHKQPPAYLPHTHKYTSFYGVLCLFQQLPIWKHWRAHAH